MQSLLEVNGLTTTFFSKQGPLKAVDQISYQISKGETLGIVGESGCGKTITSLSLLGLIDPPGKITGGEIKFKGQDLVTLSEPELRKIRGGKIAMIFQEPMTALNPVLRIGEQIAEQILAHEKISRVNARERAVDLLNIVGIPSPDKRVDDYPHQLSGGTRQRAMIAMALSCRPDLLIADEPTTALDVTIQAQILDLLLKLQEQFGMAIQFITHDLGVISEVSDRVLVMYAGRVVEEALTRDLFEHPKHPYTVGLLESIPSLEKKQNRLFAIEGVVPQLHQWSTGCRFSDRCPKVKERCRREDPVLESKQPQHSAACFFPYP